MNADDKDYKVGYKRPPAAHRFQPGESGNPAGRPKGRRNLRSLVREVANTEIEVTSGARKRKMTMAEAIVHSQFKAALQGNTRAGAIVLQLLQCHLEGDTSSSQDPQLAEREREMVREYLKSHGAKVDDAPSD